MTNKWAYPALVGAGASLAFAAVVTWLCRALGSIDLFQLLLDRTTELLPLTAISTLLRTFGSDTKTVALLGLLLATSLAGAIIGVVEARVEGRTRGQRLTTLALGIYLLLGLILVPLVGGGFFGVRVWGGFWSTQLVLALGALVFAALVTTCSPWPLAADHDADAGRRRLVATLAAVVLAVPAVLAGRLLWRGVGRLRESAGSGEVTVQTIGTDPFAFTGMPPVITPTDEFYVISKNLRDPTVDRGDWTLTIDGLVGRQLTLTLDELLARDAQEFTSTLTCISNEVGGDLISTAVWKGVPLRTLLDEAGVLPDVVDIAMRAEDGYTESIPLEKAMAPESIIVHTMNGAPLNDKHGGPARLIVPGIFGMKNVKWLTKLTAVDDDFIGFWQERGWSDIATVVTASAIVAPKSGQRFVSNEPVYIGGWAFAGMRGIERVEVSLDGGANWQQAQLNTPPSMISWRFWMVELPAGAPRGLRVLVRAIDGDGTPQLASERPPLPDGATGLHEIGIRIVEPPVA